MKVGFSCGTQSRRQLYDSGLSRMRVDPRKCDQSGPHSRSCCESSSMPQGCCSASLSSISLASEPKSICRSCTTLEKLSITGDLRFGINLTPGHFCMMEHWLTEPTLFSNIWHAAISTLSLTSDIPCTAFSGLLDVQPDEEGSARLKFS